MEKKYQDTGSYTQKDLMQHLLNVAQHVVTREEAEKGFKEVNAKIDKVEANLNKRIDKIDARIDKVDAKIDKVDAKIDKVEANLNARIDKVSNRVEDVVSKMDSQFRYTISIMVTDFCYSYRRDFEFIVIFSHISYFSFS